MQSLKEALDNPLITIAVLAIVIVGAVKSVTGDLSFKEYVDAIEVIVAGTAVGRGLVSLGSKSDKP